jgi:hypothetical protein
MHDQLTPQQREYQRYPFQQDIVIDNTIQCMSNNIGENGLSVSTLQSFVQNSIITVNIPFQGEKITVRAKVRYWQRGIGMGIEFIDLSDEQETKINRIIEHLQKSSLMS